MKCSVPFPGVIQGRRVGDGLAIGDVEARVLATIPPHPNVVTLLAGEYYFLLPYAQLDWTDIVFCLQLFSARNATRAICS